MKNMNKILLFVLILALFVSLGACRNQTDQDTADAKIPAPHSLTPAEAEDGWMLLFDGTTFKGWRGLGRHKVP